MKWTKMNRLRPRAHTGAPCALAHVAPMLPCYSLPTRSVSSQPVATGIRCNLAARASSRERGRGKVKLRNATFVFSYIYIYMNVVSREAI